ncbi:MAG: LysR family transcriptional regulator [Pseudomonadota bacterium]
MNVRFDRLSLLETFVRIAERGSLSAAARDLNISQPSVSRQLAALEARIGVVLARRTTHDLALTPDGKALLADARRLLSEWEAIEDRHAGADAVRGTVRVIAPVALGQGLLVEPATAFLKAHPHTSLAWRLTDETIRFAEEGCDAWVKVGPVPDETLVVRELGCVERIVVGTPACLAAGGGGGLATLPWLTLGPFEGSRIELFDGSGPVQSFKVTPRMASDNIIALRQAVLADLGVAIMPRWFVTGDLSAGRLMDAAPGLKAAHLAINLALASGTKRPARVEHFAAALEEWGRLNLQNANAQSA